MSLYVKYVLESFVLSAITPTFVYKGIYENRFTPTQRLTGIAHAHNATRHRSSRRSCACAEAMSVQRVF